MSKKIETESFSYKPMEPKFVKLPCSSCGKPVGVQLPFYGCIFCKDCATPKVYTIEGRGKVIKKD